jgi:hypothetical protein
MIAHSGFITVARKLEPGWGLSTSRESSADMGEDPDLGAQEEDSGG